MGNPSLASNGYNKSLERNGLLHYSKGGKGDRRPLNSKPLDLRNNMAQFQLTTEIVKLSDAATWDAAKTEWALLEVYEAEEPETCLCGHFPIIELCILQNNINKNHATVGNCCVKKFIGLPSDKIFQAVKRIRKDLGKSLNAEAIDHAFQRDWLSEWERNFYFDIMRKRSLTDKQKMKKLQINELVLTRIKRGGGVDR
jgi:hypothetical protein